MPRKLLALLLGITMCLAPGLAHTAQAEADASTLAYAEEIDKTTIMTFAISVDEAEWQSMLDNATAKEYISADITINGETVTNVGIRPKGNSTLSVIANDSTTDRYSFKIKFDEYVEGQTWLGLDKIVLNSNYADATSMKEYLSYDILSSIGVDTPLYAYADIAVNGETWGFYLAVEDVDSGYLERVKNDEGELYKPESNEIGGGGARMGVNNSDAPSMPEDGGSATPPTAEGDGQQSAAPSGRPTGRQGGGFGGMSGDSGVALLYTDDNEESYASIFDNAETKTDSDDHQRVIEAIQNLNAGTDLETYVDVDQVLRYLAGHTVVVNLDSYSGSFGHNYYLYENNGQISIIPWDYNLAFGGFQSSSASDVVNFPIDTPVSGVSMEDRPLISKLLEVPEYLAQYHAYLQEILDTYFADGAFTAKVDELDALISSYVQNDPSAFYTYEEYQTAIQALKELGTLRGESIQGQLDGSIPSTSEGQAAEPDLLIDTSTINMSDLGSMGGMGGGGFGGRGGAPGGDASTDMDTMRQAMEILNATEDGELTEAQRSQLAELGLDEDAIEALQQLPQGVEMPQDAN